ncbi:MAG: hypothetical protein IIA62_02420 [Nitrospinae bacterium]|nr:hypothetical protein [Nitrospinota bacterium]
MKAKSLFILFLSFAMMGLSPDLALSQLFGDDEKKWERVMMEMKKINSRLVSLKTKDLKGIEDNQAQLQQSQGEVLSQIQNLQNLMPNIQGVVEQSNASIGRQVSDFSAKLAELELALKAELQKNNKSQAEAIDKLKVEVSAKVDGITAQVDTMKTQVDIMKNDMSSDVNTMRIETIARLGELKEAMAADVEKIHSSMARKVDRIDQNVIGGLDTINKNLAAGVDTITQSNKALLQEFSSKQESAISQAEAIKNHEQMVLLRLSEMDAGTQKMIDILSESLAEGRAVKKGVDDLNSGMVLINENVNINREAIAKLKIIFDARLEEIKKGQADLFAHQDSGVNHVDIINQNLLVADEKINKLAETLQTLYSQNLSSAQTVMALQQQFTQVIAVIQQTDEKFDKLIDATKRFAIHSSQIDKKLDNIMIQFEASQARGGSLTDRKMGDLITILKSIADEQGNLMQKVAAQEGNLLNALNVHEGNVTQALNAHENNMTQAMSVHDGNTTQAMNAHENNVNNALKVHDANVTQALSDNSSAGVIEALKDMTQAMSVHDGNMTQAMNGHESNVNNALQVHDANVTQALSDNSSAGLEALRAHDGNMTQAMNVHEGNVTQAMNVHEGNVNKTLNVHEGNMTRALGAYEENITQALKVYAQALTVYEGNMIQAWSVHDKNSSQALAGISADNEKIRNFHGEINNSLANLRKKSNVNISRNDDILKTLRKLMPQ